MATDPRDRASEHSAPLSEAGLVRAARYIQPGQPSPDARELHRRSGRQAEEFYRERWRHDKIVRSTHGVNCTGSCSWQVYVKDGIITWETQAVDYPSVGPDSPEYEPRGCPRGASLPVGGTPHRSGWSRTVRPAGGPREGDHAAVSGSLAVSGLSGVGGPTLFWWMILPYAALPTFIIGHVWRYRYDQFGWASRSTELQERRWLKWGSPLFHYGAFAAIGGHILGILIPESVTGAIGIPEVPSRWFAASAGTAAALAVIGGVVILAGRRLLAARVRATTSPVDCVALILLAIIIGLGIAETVGVELLGSHYNYRTTISPWFRSLFSGVPEVRAAMKAPLLFQVHVIAAWVLIGVWPFTRLVHAWSYPYFSLWRPFIVYRSRVATRPHEPGTSGRRWRRIGTPY